MDSDLSEPKFWLCPAAPPENASSKNTAPEIIECEGTDGGIVILGRNPLTGVKDQLLSRETLSVEVKQMPDKSASEHKCGLVYVRPLKFPNKCLLNGKTSFKNAMDTWECGDGDEISLYMDRHRFQIVHEREERLQYVTTSELDYVEKYVEPKKKQRPSARSSNSRQSMNGRKGSSSSITPEGMGGEREGELSFLQRVMMQMRLKNAHDHISWLTWGFFLLFAFTVIAVVVMEFIKIGNEDQEGGPKTMNHRRRGMEEEEEEGGGGGVLEGGGGRGGVGGGGVLK